MNEKSHQVGEFDFDRFSKTLSLNGQQKKLSHKASRVLELLFESKGLLVSRDTLIKDVWDDNYLVGDKALTTAIWSLRKEFEDSSVNIETIPKKGYRLSISSEVEMLVEKADSDLAVNSKKRNTSFLKSVSLAFVLLLVAISYVFYQDRKQTGSVNETRVVLLSRSNLDAAITNNFIGKLSDDINSLSGIALVEETEKRRLLSGSDEIAAAAEIGVSVVIYVEISSTGRNLVGVSVKYREVESSGIAMASWQVDASRLNSLISEIIGKVPGQRWQ